MVRIGMLTALLLCSSVSAESMHRVHHAVVGIYVSPLGKITTETVSVLP